MSAPIKRDHFFEKYAAAETARATTWRMAWWSASLFGRTPKQTLRFFRSQMRNCALDALKEARINASKEVA